jgi:hypothetical protein
METIESENKGYSPWRGRTGWIEVEMSCCIGTSKREVTEEEMRD